MTKRFLFNTAAFCLVSAVLRAYGADLKADNQTVERQFQRAKAIIDANCPECIDSSREGLERGIKVLHRSLGAGYKNKVAAYKLLGEAYWGVYSLSHAEDKEALRKRNDAYRKLYALAPSDPEALRLFSITLDSDDQRLPVYEKILSLSPGDTDTRFSLGTLLIRKGNLEDGLKQLYKSFEFETERESLASAAWGILGVLQDQRCPIEDQVKALVSQIGKFRPEDAKLANPADRSGKLGELKQKVLGAFYNHKCTPSQSPEPKK